MQLRKDHAQSLIAVTAILGFVSLALTPIVAAAKFSTRAPTTQGNLKRVGCAAYLYATDYDGGVVLTQQGNVRVDRPWSVMLMPYLKDQRVYWDPTRPVITAPSIELDSGTPEAMTVLWSTITTLSINDSGYSGMWTTLGKKCSGKKLGYQYGVRNLYTMEDEENRVAFAPTTFGGTSFGWNFFRACDANWVRSGVPSDQFSWNNMVWDTNGLYAGGRIPVIHADGSAGTLTRADFKMYTERNDSLATTAYCTWLGSIGKSTWGQFWTAD